MGFEYCINCKQNVNASRKGLGTGFVFLVIATIFMLALGVFGGIAGIAVMGVIVIIAWVIYWAVYAGGPAICPICKDNNWGDPDVDDNDHPDPPPPPEPGRDRPGGITYNKWSRRPYHVLGMSLGGLVALVFIATAATYEAPLTPEQEAEVALTPLTAEQASELNGDYRTCATYTSFNAHAYTECIKQTEERKWDMRRDNWEAQQER